MWLTLLSMLGGGLMRLLPELLNFLNKKTDNAHELAMLDRQAELEKTRAAARMEELQVQGNFQEMLALLDAQKEALKGQMQVTNIPIVDALNFLVRPLTTYYFLVLYGLTKLAMFVLALNADISGWDAILKIYDTEDRAILSGIISYWFVGRTIDKQKS